MTTTATVPDQVTDTPPPAPLGPEDIRRARRAPHAAVGALVVAAVAARLAVHATGDEQTVATWTAGAAFIIAVVVATKARRRVFDKRSWRRVVTFLGVAVAWLGTVTATGLSVGAVGVLMALGYGLSLHWWRTHPVGLLVEPEAPAEYAQLWAENVGDSGDLAGSRLANEQAIKAGVRYALMLRPGKQSIDTVTNNIKKIRGGLFLRPNQELIVEEHPTLPEPHVLLTIVTRSPVRAGVAHPGVSAFDPVTGRVQLGPYSDGEGKAHWRVYSENRMWGGFVQGGTGSGKSRLIDSIALPLAESTTHPTVVLYADGQGGASSPTLMEHADYFAGTAERTLAMAMGMEMVMRLRQRENIEMRVEGFAPTADRPGLLGIIDECHNRLMKALNPLYWEATQRIVATVAREGGKVGVTLILASQEPTLGAFGGAGSPYCEVLRGSLLTGNGIMLAGDDPNAKTIFGINVNPKQFPIGGGYGYVAKPGPGDRRAMFRANYLTDRIRATWPSRIVWRELTGPAAALFPGYLKRERTFAERQAVVEGMPLGQSTPQPATGPSDGAVLDVFGAVGFPSWAEMEAEARREAARALHEGHQKVLTAIRGGASKAQAIADATGYSVRQVHNLLGELVEAGKVHKVVEPGRKLGAYEAAKAA